ncbi:MAG: YraN family protein [Lachnospiraceae bacterium]|nr:YraN family protein [Lachnospiraceae bacterium]
MNKRSVGDGREKMAAAYLSGRGVRIAEKNFRLRQGEIDLIGYEDKTLVFFEVKYRKNADCGSPAEAVGIRKQTQICRVAAFYRSFHNISFDTPVRYDVISILGDEITWIKNAFPERVWGL